MEEALLKLGNTENAKDIVAALKEVVDSSWPVLADDPVLDADNRADLIRKFEEIDELLDEARHLCKESSEDE